MRAMLQDCQIKFMLMDNKSDDDDGGGDIDRGVDGSEDVWHASECVLTMYELVCVFMYVMEPGLVKCWHRRIPAVAKSPSPTHSAQPSINVQNCSSLIYISRLNHNHKKNKN